MSSKTKPTVTDLERQEALAFAIFQLRFHELELPLEAKDMRQKEVWQTFDEIRKAFRDQATAMVNLAESVGLDIRVKKPSLVKEKIASFRMLPPQPAYQLGE